MKDREILEGIEEICSLFSVKDQGYPFLQELLSVFLFVSFSSVLCVLNVIIPGHILVTFATLRA